MISANVASLVNWSMKVHTRQQVAATRRSNISQRQIASCVLGYFVAATSHANSV